MSMKWFMSMVLAVTVLLAGCASFKNAFNLGDGKILGVVSYEIPEMVLPDGTKIESGSSLVDVLMTLGINVAANEMMDKWNVRSVYPGVDENGRAVTKVETDYGTFTFATGEIAETIKGISFGSDPGTDTLEIYFEDEDGTISAGRTDIPVEAVDPE